MAIVGSGCECVEGLSHVIVISFGIIFEGNLLNVKAIIGALTGPQVD